MKQETYIPLLIASTVLLFDRATKYWALTACVVRKKIMTGISCKLALNTGITWSLFATSDRSVQAVITVIVAALIWGLLLYTIKRYEQRKLIYGELLVLAGALSNLYDRLIYAGVIDFIVLSYKKYTWPVFNIADMAICCGIIIMSITVIKEG